MGSAFPGVTGFLTPAMVGRDSRGRVLNAFTNPDDVERIAAGSACGNCCATYSVYMAVCPICHTPRDVSQDVQDAPEMWQAHADERNYGSGKTRTRTADEFLRDLSRDKDVDQVKLSQLGRSKWGRK